MRLLLLKYNKVTNDAFEKFAKHSQFDIIWGDLDEFGRKKELLDFDEVDHFLRCFIPFHAVMVGDIFWPTGQNICRWSGQNRTKCYFLQHGQWIYTRNKRNPRFLPSCTFVYGDNVKNEIRNWPYGKRARIEAVGNPRYDKVELCNGDYTYFSPPVIVEKCDGVPDIVHDSAISRLRALKGVDSQVKIMIQPHYRERCISELMSIFPQAAHVRPEADPLPLIANSKNVLTHRNSTVVLDGIATRKQVVLMNFLKGTGGYYARDYFAPFAVESANLEDCISNLQNSAPTISNYQARCKPFLYLGNASERIDKSIRQDFR